MRKVISNTTSILSLLKINRLSLLKELYGSVIVPQAVFQEIENGKEKPYYTDLSKLGWINIQQIINPGSLDYFFDLDRGEAEVLLLARELKADLVILDENLGRRYARQLDLTLTGTIGILLRAKQKGLIPSIKESILELTVKRFLVITSFNS
jgi:predicted nucleic acid-binding protein